jgi:antibiotic biosynthesis monooxygenase (ABM) superfamily enzyme
MIWLCVFPTLTVLNVMFGDWLASMPPVVRTFVQATIAVPIVIYGLMPHLGGERRASRPRARGQSPVGAI